MNAKRRSHPLRLRKGAASRRGERPAFLSPPAGAPPYYGFPLVPETLTDGWCYGAITEFIDPENYPDGCDSGDGFVQAPDGSRAGLIWWTDCPGPIFEAYPPDGEPGGRWGVFEVRFPLAVRTLDDLIASFRHVLPLLQARYPR